MGRSCNWLPGKVSPRLLGFQGSSAPMLAAPVADGWLTFAGLSLTVDPMTDIRRPASVSDADFLVDSDHRYAGDMRRGAIELTTSTEHARALDSIPCEAESGEAGSGEECMPSPPPPTAVQHPHPLCLLRAHHRQHPCRPRLCRLLLRYHPCRLHRRRLHLRPHHPHHLRRRPHRRQARHLAHCMLVACKSASSISLER